MLNVKALLNKILNNIEYKELLWTNPNPAADFVEQTVLSGTDLSVYDGVDIEVAEGTIFHVYYDESKTFYITLIYSIISNAYAGVASRGVSIRTHSGIVVGSCYTKKVNATKSSTDNTRLKPYKIYGIRKLGGY